MQLLRLSGEVPKLGGLPDTSLGPRDPAGDQSVAQTDSADIVDPPPLSPGQETHRTFRLLRSCPCVPITLAHLGNIAAVSVWVTSHVLRRSFGRIAYRSGVPVPTVQRIFGHVSIDQTLYHIGLGQDEMTEGFAVFDTHMRAGMEPPISLAQRQTAF